MRNKVLIIGGAGFIGVNLADFYLKNGWQVSLVDNLSRLGSKKNLDWLLKKWGSGFKFQRIDLGQLEQLKNELEKADVVFHLAAQVAVTSSLKNPALDFEVNLKGSFELLEMVRKLKRRPVLIYASTNKVYGDLKNIKINEKAKRYVFGVSFKGISEDQPLDFRSPYSCSKGGADAYFQDYGRLFGLKTVVFRQSCIYGPHQYGNEDQGWLSHFLKQAISGLPISIYGNGKQVRDVLWIEDLIEAYDLAVRNITKVKGEVFNIGGGYKNSLSLLELTDILEKKLGKKIRLKFEKERVADQKIFISDNRKLEKRLGWQPETSYTQGIGRMLKWLKER
ncbi:MAG TPA: GDP-mannose 4,6-dehydratase [Candidatus Bathyarchaeia archaeon]|nr:GDP-mannose 4,6-dehydratase [Candidatus Bathyarchaeia archaeon]